MNSLREIIDAGVARGFGLFVPVLSGGVCFGSSFAKGVDYVDHNDPFKSKTYNGFAFEWIMWIIMIHSKARRAIDR